MPQLEQIGTYISQVFWLVLTFGALYLILWRTALPRVAQMLERRQQRIEGDIEKAEHLRDEAEGVLKAYEAAVAEARTQAQTVLREAADRIAMQSEERHASLSEKLATEAEAAEKRIAEAREQALANIRTVAVEVAQAATARLAGVSAPEADAQAAVDAAMQERR